MNKLSKKSKLILGIVICIITIAIILTILFFYKKSNSILFKSTYMNAAWTPTSYGYLIYSNGIIKEYDDYNEDKDLKSAKITNEELNKLKELANIVEDKYEKDDRFQMFDAGVSTKEIYSETLERWVVLSKSGDTMGRNNTETSEEILNLIAELYNKYLDN